LTAISGKDVFREVYTQVSGNISKEFDLSGYKAGYYFLSTKSDAWVIIKKIVKQ